MARPNMDCDVPLDYGAKVSEVSPFSKEEVGMRKSRFAGEQILDF
jgi:hypothetical protein